MKRRLDSTFPSHHAIQRLGGKTERVGRLLEYCRSREGYDDVVRMCEEYVPRKQDVSDKPVCKEEQIGFVYSAKSGRFYKIGKSNAPGRREYELALQLPEKLKMVHFFKTDDPGGIETYWHNRFEAKRKNGEWFDLSATDVAAFKRRKLFM